MKAPALAREPVIVCVDDQAMVLTALSEQLRRGLGAGIAIELASSGAEALALLDELAAEGHPLPLVICDQIMPGMGGAELLCQIHQRHPQTLNILLTGQADADAVALAVNRANLYRYLSKPWDESDLVLTAKEALRRHGQDRLLASQAAALTRSHALLRATLDATADGILVCDRDGQVVDCNAQMLTLWQLGDSQPLRALEDLQPRLQDPQGSSPFSRADGAASQVLVLQDGRHIECRRRALRTGDEGTALSVFSFRDVTERERHLHRLSHMALHDGLTGLPNRVQFEQALQEGLANAHAQAARLAVWFIDIDHFKRVNDSLGHTAGDDLLRQVILRVRGCLRGHDLLARWGGDEFTVLLPALAEAADAEAVARRVHEALAAPIEVAGRLLRVSASIGIAMYPEDGADVQTLLQRADAALYHVKANGRNGFRRFADAASGDALCAAAAERLALENDLCQALSRGEMTLHYQPQVDADSGRITRVEALARWQHPQRGAVSPAVFIPLAEQVGLIGRIGAWALATACRDAQAWQANGGEGIGVAVNVSTRELTDPALADRVRDALATSGLDAGLLELELTESAALGDGAATADSLRALRELGVAIALDDFGTGFASLSQLKHLHCQTLKIDRSFVAEVVSDRKDAAIVRSVIALAQGLGLRVVAEGVETAEAASCLRRLGCENLQGYWLGRPMALSALTALIHSSQAAESTA